MKTVESFNYERFFRMPKDYAEAAKEALTAPEILTGKQRRTARRKQERNIKKLF